MAYVAPDPGKGWRLLKVGERRTSGCEFFDADHPDRGWVETSCAGITYTSNNALVGMFYRTREGVKPTVHTAKASITIPADYLKAEKWRRLALRMSKAKTIREAREMHRKAVGK